jgi:peptidoglycan/xylan/chitin deacetylase (PgdA/CDA1 family)
MPAAEPGSGETSDAIPVLLYHSVPPASDPDPLSVPQELFRDHMEAVTASGRSPVSVGELAAGLRGEKALPTRPVAITFDDAYDDTPAAIDLVLSHGLTASVFVTTGQLDSGRMISSEQLERLSTQPDRVELGAHTVSHPFLDEISRDQVDWELGESKRTLEALIGRAVLSFAYPFGAYSREVRAAVVDAGFSSAAAVKNAISHPADDPWAIARWTVRGRTTAGQLERILAGDGAPRAWASERLRTRAYRTARRLRRRLLVGGIER